MPRGRIADRRLHDFRQKLYFQVAEDLLRHARRTKYVVALARVNCSKARACATVPQYKEPKPKWKPAARLSTEQQLDVDKLELQDAGWREQRPDSERSEQLGVSSGMYKRRTKGVRWSIELDEAIAGMYLP